jgi:hypothetical protein
MSVSLTSALSRHLQQSRTRLRERFETADGAGGACSVCGPPKRAAFVDRHQGQRLCARCAAERYEISWARIVADVGERAQAEARNAALAHLEVAP